MKFFILLIFLVNCSTITNQVDESMDINPAVAKSESANDINLGEIQEAIKKGEVIPNLTDILQVDNQFRSVLAISVILLQSLYKPNNQELFVLQIISVLEENNEHLNQLLKETKVLNKLDSGSITMKGFLLSQGPFSIILKRKESRNPIFGEIVNLAMKYAEVIFPKRGCGIKRVIDYLPYVPMLTKNNLNDSFRFAINLIIGREMHYSLLSGENLKIYYDFGKKTYLKKWIIEGVASSSRFLPAEHDKDDPLKHLFMHFFEFSETELEFGRNLMAHLTNGISDPKSLVEFYNTNTFILEQFLNSPELAEMIEVHGLFFTFTYYPIEETGRLNKKLRRLFKLLNTNFLYYFNKGEVTTNDKGIFEKFILSLPDLKNVSNVDPVAHILFHGLLGFRNHESAKLIFGLGQEDKKAIETWQFKLLEFVCTIRTANELQIHNFLGKLGLNMAQNVNYLIAQSMFEEYETVHSFNTIFDNLLRGTKGLLEKTKEESEECIKNFLNSLNPNYLKLLKKNTIFEVADELCKLPFKESVFHMLKEHMKVFYPSTNWQKMILLLKNIPSVKSFKDSTEFNLVADILTKSYLDGEATRKDAKYITKKLNVDGKKAFFNWISSLQTPFSQVAFSSCRNNSENLINILWNIKFNLRELSLKLLANIIVNSQMNNENIGVYAQRYIDGILEGGFLTFKKLLKEFKAEKEYGDYFDLIFVKNKVFHMFIYYEKYKEISTDIEMLVEFINKLVKETLCQRKAFKFLRFFYNLHLLQKFDNPEMWAGLLFDIVLDLKYREKEHKKLNIFFHNTADKNYLKRWQAIILGYDSGSPQIEESLTQLKSGEDFSPQALTNSYIHRFYTSECVSRMKFFEIEFTFAKIILHAFENYQLYLEKDSFKFYIEEEIKSAKDFPLIQAILDLKPNFVVEDKSFENQVLEFGIFYPFIKYPSSLNSPNFKYLEEAIIQQTQRDLSPNAHSQIAKFFQNLSLLSNFNYSKNSQANPNLVFSILFNFCTRKSEETKAHLIEFLNNFILLSDENLKILDLWYSGYKEHKVTTANRFRTRNPSIILQSLLKLTK
jgi:phage pi2 protein 07